MTHAGPLPAPRLAGALRDPWLLGLLAAGLALRVGLLLWIGDDLVLRGDSRVYASGAAALRETGVLDTGHFVRPPLYFAFLAAAGALAELWGGSPLRTAQWLQCALSVATALPVYRTAQRVGGRRVARAAAAFLLLDPTLVAFSHLLWPETLCLFLVAVVFDALAGLEARRLRAAAGVGALFGLALLIKPVLGVFALLLTARWLREPGGRRALALVGAFGGAALLVVGPWVARNQWRYGPAILLENQAPYNLWIGNDPGPPRRVIDEWIALGDPARRSRVGWERGWQAVRAAPAAFAAGAMRRALNLWGLEFFAVRLPTVGGYGAVGRGSFLAAFWTVQAGWILALLAAVLGLPRAWRDPTLRLLLLYAAVFTGLVALLAATTRFRVPFAFPLAVCAGLGAQRVLDRDLKRRDLAALAAALALLGVSASRPLFRALMAADVRDARELDHPEWHYFRY